MPYYHVYMLARPDATRELLLEMLSRMSTTVVQRGGVLRGIDNLGIRHMAYVMRRHQHVATVARCALRVGGLAGEPTCHPQCKLPIHHSFCR